MIVVVDYGMGNLRSVSKALEHLDVEVLVSSDWKDIQKADKIVLPGVGSFGDAVRELHAKSLFEPIQDAVREGKKFLGICLGLQLLMGSSEESPGAAGLGLFPGKVVRFSSAEDKVPHMGWNSVAIASQHPLLEGLAEQAFFYFVHSFYVDCSDASFVIGTCDYAKKKFTAILGNENVFATQFHPEKSQDAGLQILKNFIRW